MVKGPSRTAFYFFMVEHVLKQHRFSNFTEGLPLGRELWKKLSKDGKAPYEEREKEWREYLRGPAGDSYRKNCLGKPIKEQIDEQNQKIELEKQMNRVTAEYIQPGNYDQPFYFIDFEYALKDDYGNYFPCEVGLVKYTLRSGVVQTLHFFLNPGDYPLGTKGEAKKRCEMLKIPFLGFDRWTRDYSSVVSRIRCFLLDSECCVATGRAIPPLYSVPKNIECTRKCFEALVKKAERPVSDIPDIVSASTLLVELFGLERCHKTKAMESLESTMYEYTKDVPCDWHYDKESSHCALATAKKIAFSISETIPYSFNIHLTPKHLPVTGASDLNSNLISEAPGASFGSSNLPPVYNDDVNEKNMEEQVFAGDKWTVSSVWLENKSDLPARENESMFSLSSQGAALSPIGRGNGPAVSVRNNKKVCSNFSSQSYSNSPLGRGNGPTMPAAAAQQIAQPGRNKWNTSTGVHEAPSSFWVESDDDLTTIMMATLNADTDCNPDFGNYTRAIGRGMPFF